MTLTHVSGVSGLSEPLVPGAGQQEAPDVSEDFSARDEVEALQRQLLEANEQLARLV